MKKKRFSWYCTCLVQCDEDWRKAICPDDILIVDNKTGLAYLGKSHEGYLYKADMTSEVEAWLR